MGSIENSERLPIGVTAVLATAAVASRWVFRSHALFSWDSANFAMALDKIDIEMHRPHPPGYLGYVFAARALRHLFTDTNTALVVWNIIATALAVAIVARFAFDVADPGRRRLTAATAALILLTSPLVWFYGEVAEIYASELLLAAAVGYAAARAARGEDRAIYWAVAALAITAGFKIVTALLMLPAVAFAWTRVSRAARRRSFTMAVMAAVIVTAVFLIVQPHLWTVATRLIGSSEWSTWGLNVDREDFFRTVNRNIRSALTAAIVAVGVVNVAALVVWAIRDRRLPFSLNSGVAWAWTLPILLFCAVVVIAKPGYLLPFVPLAAIVIATFYARLTPLVATTCIALQATVNVAHFLWLSPFSAALTGGESRYRDKTMWQRAASDLQPLTFPTHFTIRESDRHVTDLLAVVDSVCLGRQPVIVADLLPVDWRRVMFYVPNATAIHANQSGVDFVGHQTDFASLPPEGRDFITSCPVIWLAPDEGPAGMAKPLDASAQRIPLVGWQTRPAALHVTPQGIQSTPAGP